MAQSMVEEFTSNPEGMKLFQQERFILELTSLIREVMRHQGNSKADLARLLGRSRSYVTQLLDGRANMTARTISDVMFVLGCSLHVSAGQLSLSTPSDVKSNASKADSVISYGNSKNWQTIAVSSQAEGLGKFSIYNPDSPQAA